MSDVVNLRDFPHKGRVYELPDDVVRVDRGTAWGNPYRIGDLDPNYYPMDRQQVLSLYKRYLEAKAELDPLWLEPLRGKRLACWCAPLACHGNLIQKWLSEHPPKRGSTRSPR